MITESKNPFLILDTAIILINEFRLISENPTLDFNQLRLVSSLFQEIIDANSCKLYPDYVFKCKDAYLKFLEAKFLYEEDSWTHGYALNLAKQTYNKEKITYNFFSIFSGPLVTFDRICATQKSFNEALRDLQYNVPRQLFKGHDKIHGSFVTGCFYYGKHKKSRMFIVSPLEYRFYIEERDKLSMDLPVNKERRNFLKDLMQTGFAYEDKKCQWLGHEDWKEKYKSHLQNFKSI